MDHDRDVAELADALRVSVGLLRRQLRKVRVEGDLTPAETSALLRLERGGPTTAAALARREQISPQGIGMTVAGLEARGLVERRADPDDGRQVMVSITQAGGRSLRQRREHRNDQLAKALSSELTRAEQRQLMSATRLLDRLAQRL